MVGIAEAVGLITSMISTVDQIVRLAEAAQRNREKCTQLKDHVQMIRLLLTELQSQWTPDPVTHSMLRNLELALNDGMALVESCRDRRTWSLVFRTKKKANKIAAVDARISKILETFHVANMILIISINKERFFLKVLEKLLQDDAVKRLPQNAKEELKSCIGNLTNMDNMSSDAKTLLEWIIKDLEHGDNNAEGTISESSLHPGRGGSPTANNEIVGLARSIVRDAKALRHNREEIQLMVQFVQQIADLMQQPQSSELSRDPNTAHLVRNLEGHLREAFSIVSHNVQHRNNRRIAQTFLCAVDGGYYWQQPDNILRVAYKIEYYVQILPVIAMRQMFA